MFDCVMPTRNARNGTIFTRYGDLKIRNAATRPTTSRSIPAAPATPARARRRGVGPGRAVSRAYLHHLDRCGEMLGPMLTTIHNLHYYLNLMREVREALTLAPSASSAPSSRPTGPGRVARPREPGAPNPPWAAMPSPETIMRLLEFTHWSTPL